MKSGTIELMKFKRLERVLGESRRGIVGLLELLWQGTAKNCPTGNIGKFDNEEIAIICDWENDPDILVAALVKCGWLDECETNRLLVHDWEEHCPKYVKGNVIRHGKSFANRSVLIGASYKEAPNRSLVDDPTTKPNQTKPSQTKPKGCFAPPSIEDVAVYCKEKGYTFDPEVFVAYYGSQGWQKANGRKITSWQRCCVTFEKNHVEPASGQPARQSVQTARRENNQAVLKRSMERHDGESRDDCKNDGNANRELATRNQRSVDGNLFTGGG